MKLKPLHDRLIIKPLDASAVTKSGILIPDNAQEKPQKGTVLAVGKGKLTNDGQLIPLSVNEGDTVLYSKNAGQIVKVDNIEHIVLKEDEILAIVE